MLQSASRTKKLISSSNLLWSVFVMIYIFAMILQMLQGGEIVACGHLAHVWSIIFNTRQNATTKHMTVPCINILVHVPLYFSSYRTGICTLQNGSRVDHGLEASEASVIMHDATFSTSSTPWSKMACDFFRHTHIVDLFYISTTVCRVSHVKGHVH